MTLRAVIAALEEQGLSCTISTMQRWAKDDFAPRKRKSAIQYTVKENEKVQATAHKAVKEGIEREEAMQATRREQIQGIEAQMEVLAESLKEVEEGELCRMNMRERMITQIVLAKLVRHRAPSIVHDSPEKLAKLFEALNLPPAAPTTIVLPKPDRPDDAKVVNGRVLPEKSETALAIEAFQARMREERLREARQRHAAREKVARNLTRSPYLHGRPIQAEFPIPAPSPP
jgi:hypothetical protein